MLLLGRCQRDQTDRLCWSLGKASGIMLGAFCDLSTVFPYAVVGFCCMVTFLVLYAYTGYLDFQHCFHSCELDAEWPILHVWSKDTRTPSMLYAIYNVPPSCKTHMVQYPFSCYPVRSLAALLERHRPYNRIQRLREYQLDT